MKDQEKDKRLKMVALDSEDLEILSAHCQDAVLKAGDLQFLPKENRFILSMNRYIWEKGEKQPERRRSILHFERVLKVSVQGIDRNKKDQVLSLLALVFKVSDAPAGTIELVFSGNCAIRLTVECIEAQLADMQASWAASSKPHHLDI